MAKKTILHILEKDQIFQLFVGYMTSPTLKGHKTSLEQVINMMVSSFISTP